MNVYGDDDDASFKRLMQLHFELQLRLKQGLLMRIS